MKKIFILVILAILTLYNVDKRDYVIIPEQSIRMRVIASSNSKEDIKNKIIIKKGLEKELNNIIKDTNSYDEADRKLSNSYDLIDKNIRYQMKENNIKESYTINYGYNYFPEKKKSGVLYKSGNYKSYVVTLGEGKGNNFWCVLFPPLCLIDDNSNNYSFLIKDILTKYNW